jgi:hypothetical protein
MEFERHAEGVQKVNGSRMNEWVNSSQTPPLPGLGSASTTWPSRPPLPATSSTTVEYSPKTGARQAPSHSLLTEDVTAMQYSPRPFFFFPCIASHSPARDPGIQRLVISGPDQLLAAEFHFPRGSQSYWIKYVVSYILLIFLDKSRLSAAFPYHASFSSIIVSSLTTNSTRNLHVLV